MTKSSGAGQRVIALAGNPNVGKSTVFNSLTGLRQHTGNWPGKTVSNAVGRCAGAEGEYTIVDIPGTYSLIPRSAEEEVARDYICFGGADAVAVVCDATCLERNMNLLLQIMETGQRVLLIVNLMDEARSKGIHIELDRLEALLGIPVLGTVARERGCRRAVTEALDALFADGEPAERFKVTYAPELEQALDRLTPLIPEALAPARRWLALRLLEGDEALLRQAHSFPFAYGRYHPYTDC